MSLEKIEKEVNYIVQFAAQLNAGPVHFDEDLSLRSLRLSAERLLYEIAYYEIEKKTKGTISMIKGCGWDKATRDGEAAK